MGPILGFSLGFIVKDKKMLKNSFWAHLLGITTAVATGIILSLIFNKVMELHAITSEMPIRSYLGVFDILFPLRRGLLPGSVFPGRSNLL